LAIARVTNDGSGRWMVSYRGGRRTFADEMAARMFMLALMDGGAE
jgi:hypothetical protein